MDGMGRAAAVDRPCSGLGKEETRPIPLTVSRERKPMRQLPSMMFELFRPMA